MRTHGAGRLGRPDAASPRRGVAVVMVVACLATFSLIALAMLQGSLAARASFAVSTTCGRRSCSSMLPCGGAVPSLPMAASVRLRPSGTCRRMRSRALLPPA